MIILLDVTIVAVSTALGYLLRFNFEFDLIDNYNPLIGIGVNATACLIALYLTKSYAGIVRYTGLKDGLRVFQTLIIAHSLSSVCNIVYNFSEGRNIIPYSVILISFLASFLFLFQYRLLIKNIFSYYGKIYRKKNNVAIFGAGQMGIVTKHLLDDDYRSGYQVVAFFEDDVNKVGKEINGTNIHAFNKLDEVVAKHEIRELIIAVNKLSVERKNEIVDTCLNYGIKVRTVPDLNTWVQGELSINQIKEVKIDDLLERDSISIMNKELIDQISSKTVLITGAAGSIGSELVRQVLKYRPKKLILLDQAESPLYDLTTGLSNEENVYPYVADITNYTRVKEIFLEHEPALIYHAAAYKHVPLMEEHPTEAVSCNIIGTRNMADLAVEFKCEKFVMVSTDKAVNPTNVMGASKRIAEMYIQSINALKGGSTSFITTRFGNVLGSNGSVIPFFRRQIEQGGPITVTHPEITRYFMTISEACELILEAGCMGNGGEIFLFDMGKSVKIIDLAKKMIRLSGYEPFKDIDIIFTGLRKGEKLYEELLADKENTLPTHNQKILIAKVATPNFETIKHGVEELEGLLTQHSDLALVSAMKKMVPEYKSNRSVYEVLDT
ncbi:nucleoside-diphosphate sugar epimerase/dehydratase [Fulvivirga sp.]|uniref:polysaccharide biosynthesis protein n=1 Tax=Fulvivirga sp. TaxID=1931237 RepID=UPI0032EF1016